MRFYLLQPDSLPTYAPASGDTTGVWHNMSVALQESMVRVLSLLVRILPGVLAFALTLAVMTGLGMLASLLLRRVLAGARFDERLARRQGSSGYSQDGIADWSPEHSPTALVGRIAFWTFVLLGLIIGTSALDVSYSPTAVLSVSLLPYLTRSVGAILLLFAGNLVARFLARTVLIGAVNNQLQYARFLSMGVKWLVLVLTAAMVLDHLQVGGTIVELAFGILFGGIVLTLALAIGLGSRDLVSRSLERTGPGAGDGAERDAAPLPPAQRDSGETLRHF